MARAGVKEKPHEDALEPVPLADRDGSRFLRGGSAELRFDGRRRGRNALRLDIPDFAARGAGIVVIRYSVPPASAKPPVAGFAVARRRKISYAGCGKKLISLAQAADISR